MAGKCMYAESMRNTANILPILDAMHSDLLTLNSSGSALANAVFMAVICYTKMLRKLTFY
jgi:hypothetical protein